MDGDLEHHKVLSFTGEHRKNMNKRPSYSEIKNYSPKFE
jgi:hypothetical protein